MGKYQISGIFKHQRTTSSIEIIFFFLHNSIPKVVYLISSVVSSLLTEIIFTVTMKCPIKRLKRFSPAE